MSVIYTPRGKAREYSPYACNLYNGCNHGCLYCYGPSIRFTTRDKFLTVQERRNIVQEFEKDCKKLSNFDSQVQFCFMTDPYNSLEPELRLTRQCLEIAHRYKIPISILTKSETVLEDLDLIKSFGENIKVGFTLTCSKKESSLYWEPNASLPDARIKTLKILHENNIKTWASFEPVMIPAESLEMMENTIPYVDIYKIGKINNYQKLDKTIDWVDFLDKTVNMLRTTKKPFYVKKDLREAALAIKLYGNEVLMDEFNLGKWK